MQKQSDISTAKCQHEPTARTVPSFEEEKRDSTSNNHTMKEIENDLRAIKTRLWLNEYESTY